MKKLLLLAAAALTVVACKKDSDDPTPQGGEQGGGTQTSTQTESPYLLGETTYPKTIVTVEQDNTRRGNDQTTTVTYTISPKKLLTEFTSLSKYANGIVSSNSKMVLSYDDKNLLKEILNTNLKDNTTSKIQLLYVNGKVDKIFETYLDGSVATSTYTYNNQGKVHTIHKKDAYSDMKTTITYNGNEIIEEVYDNDENNVYSKDKITLDANGNVIKSEDLKNGGYVVYGYDNKKNYENNEISRILGGSYGLARAGYSKNNVISTQHSSVATPTTPAFEYTDSGYIKKKTSVSVNTYGDPLRPQTQVVTITTNYSY